MRKKYYHDYDPNKLHQVPGSKHRFGWFYCTFTQRDFIVFKGVGNIAQAQHCWKTLIGPTPPTGPEDFAGLHVALGSLTHEDRYRGSAIFLSNNTQSLLAHETLHAVCRCFDYLNIHSEEARCLALSSYLEEFSRILKLKK